MKQLIVIVFLNYVFVIFCSGQETGYGSGYQSLLINNPGLPGSEGTGAVRLSYLNFYPGNHYNLHSFFASYDSYFPSLHGGAGFWLADDYLGGIVNDIRGGLSYAYSLQAGKELFINAGLSASVFHRGFNFGGAIFPDQIDPLGGVSLPSSESLGSRGRTVFDIGAGFLFIYRDFFGGIAINHISKPDLSFSGSSADRLRRKFLLHATRKILLNEGIELSLRPVGYAEFQGGLISGGAGTALESRNLSINAIISADNARTMDVQAGFTIKTGKIAVFYNYRFNIVSGNYMMPFSLLHQTGVAFSLNNVDKRNGDGTISFPIL